MTSLEQSFVKAVGHAYDQRGKPAVLGKMDGTLYWTDSNGRTYRTKVWARIGESNSNQEQVIDCLNASPQVGLPVRVDYVNGTLSVVTIDYKRAEQFGDGRTGTNVPAHAWLHSRLGPDPVFIEGLQYLPLLVTPTIPADMTVTVQGGTYDWSGLKVFETAVSGSLSSYVPASENHFVIICLDRGTGTVVIVDGTDVSATDILFPDVTVTAAEIEAVTIDPDYLPLAVVLLYAGQTKVKAVDIVRDLRTGGGGGGGGTPGGSDTQIQYNDGGAFGGDASLVWDNTGKTLTIEKSTSTTLESFLELTQTGTGGAFVNFTAGTTSGRVGVTSTAFRISSGYAVSISGDTLGLTASDYVLFDPGGYSNIRFQGSGSNPAAVFNLGNYSNYNFQVLTGNNDYMVFVDSSLDAFQIGNSSAGTIASFSNSGVVINNEEADRDFRIAGNGVTNGYFYDAGNNTHGFGTGTPSETVEVISGATSGIRIKNVSSTSGDYLSLVDSSATRAYIAKHSASGASLIDIDPYPDDGSSASTFRFFRAVNTSGAVSFDVYLGNNTSTRNASIAGNGANTFLAAKNGNVGIGTASPAASAKLEVSSTTGALLLPRMTTTQRNALTAVNGMIIYSSTNNRIEAYENGSWVDL